MIESLLTSTSISKQPLDHQKTQWWLESNITELRTDIESCAATATKFEEATLDFEKEGRRAPPMAVLMNQVLLRYAPEDMEFSLPLLNFVTAVCDRPAVITMYAWSIVIETLRAQRTVSLRDFRHTFGPNGIPDSNALRSLWDAQKIPRDPVTRSDNWMDLGEAWTLEGLARKTADA